MGKSTPPSSSNISTADSHTATIQPGGCHKDLGSKASSKRVAFVPTPAGSPGESPAVLLPPSGTGAETRGTQNAHASVQWAGEGAFLSCLLEEPKSQLPRASIPHSFAEQLHLQLRLAGAANQSRHQPQLAGGELFF